MKLPGKTVFYVAAVALFLVIVLQNAGVVTLRLFFWRLDVSTIVIVPVLIVVGFIAGFFYGKSNGQ